MPTTAQISNTFNTVHFVLLRVVEDFSETLIFCLYVNKTSVPLPFRGFFFAGGFWESSRLGRTQKLMRVQKTEKLVHAQLQTPKQACVPAAWNI